MTVEEDIATLKQRVAYLEAENIKLHDNVEKIIIVVEKQVKHIDAILDLIQGLIMAINSRL